MEFDEKICFYVLMPVYKVEKYVEQSIKSVLEQTYTNFILIAVDDGSPDDSAYICDELAKNEERLCVIHQVNAGQIAARQRALEEAYRIHGQRDAEQAYIMFLDSDDWLEFDALERIHNHLINMVCDCVIFGFQKVLDGEITYKTNDEYACLSRKEATRKICMDTTYNSLCRKVVKIEVIPLVDYERFYHVRVGEDLLQTLDILRGAKSFLFIPDVLYNYRTNFSSITQTQNIWSFDYSFVVNKAVLDFLIVENVYNPSELKEQKNLFINQIYNQMRLVLNSNCHKNQKIELLSRIRESSFFNLDLLPDMDLRKYGYKQRFIMKNFAKKRYWLLLLCMSIVNIFRKNKKDLEI